MEAVKAGAGAAVALIVREEGAETHVGALSMLRYFQQPLAPSSSYKINKLFL